MKDRENIKKLYLTIKEDFNAELIKLILYREIIKHQNKKEDLLNNCLNENEYISIEYKM